MDAFDLARAEAMLVGYDARWLADMSLYEVLGVEVEFRAPLVNPETGAESRTWRRGGKLDVTVRERRTGREGFVEHKSSSEDITPGAPYWRQLRMDGQVTGYFLGAETIGLRPEFCLYDVLGKPGLRPYKAGAKRKLDETPAEYRDRCIEDIATDPTGYFGRVEVARLAVEMEEAAYDDWQTAQQMREAQRLGRAPRNPDACKKWGRMCSYFEVCTGEASLDDRSKFRQSTINPELISDGGLPILSASRMRAARSCQRLHKYEYIDRIRPAGDAGTLQFGSLIHLGLEAWWSTEGDRLIAAIEAVRNPQPRKEVA